MHRTIYLSTATRAIGQQEIENIVSISSARNAACNVTGLLLFDGRRFIQALEGEKAFVHQTMERIRKDRRHHGIIIMLSDIVADRQFGSWSMRGRTLINADDAQAFYDEVGSFLERVEAPNVFAAFLGFASASKIPFRGT